MLFALGALAGGASPGAAEVEFFETKIRPVLVAECYECHAGDKRKGGLALDSRAGWMAGGDSGEAIVPGAPEKSLLIRTITHEEADLKMPKKAPKLDEAVIADFVAWVKMGAPDPREKAEAKPAAGKSTWADTLASRSRWWCFQPVAQAAIPEPKNAAWSGHPVDRFLLAKMEAAGLAPGADAEARVLLRRLSFALTGLPPSVEEVKAFVAATAQDRAGAIAAAADRLLAAPAFGERWARHWMDLVRYAETYGSEHDYLNPYAWRYRDYLIRAFNSDLPYDHFVQEQVAGDLLPPRWNRELGLNEAALATAWHRMIESYATPVDVKREEATVIDWQIEALGKTFLGLTIQCARCHDHKFDPISDEDFYALYGVFASTRPAMSILSEPAKLTAHDAEILRLKDEIRPALAVRWQRDLQPAELEGVLRRDAKDALAPLRAMAKADDFARAWKDWRKPPAGRTEEVVFADFTGDDLAGWSLSGPGLPTQPSAAGLLTLGAPGAWVRAIQPRGFYSDAISHRHSGALRSPDFTIEKRAVSVLAGGAGNARLRLVIENFQNDLLLFGGVNPNLDAPAPRWITMKIKEQWLGRRARVEILTRDSKTCVGHTKEQEKWEKSDGPSAFGIRRVVLHDGPSPSAPSVFPAAFLQSEPGSFIKLVEQLSAAAQASLERWAGQKAKDEDARFLQALLESGALTNSYGRVPDVDKLLTRFYQTEQKIPKAVRAPGVCEDGHGYDSALFPRGDHLNPGATVPRRFLEVLGGARLWGHESGRLALARELTRPDNPLTARVMVNRIWQRLTGRGLAPTPDNFGRMGEKPTHPELLDYLARKFMEDGWSVKKLVRHMVTSRAWALSCEPVEGAAARDPGNVLLASARVRRLDAESIRDALLAIAGNLHREHEGPGVRVFYRTLIDPDKQPPAGPIDGAGRRSIYLEARRLFPSEFLATFDAPKPNIFTGQRSETNVPAQSLALLNDPFVHHQAKLWATRLEGADIRARIESMYLEALGRPPHGDECVAADAFVRARGETGWRDLAHAIFNMKEFLYLQ